jgi:hypothetical protein
MGGKAHGTRHAVCATCQLGVADLFFDGKNDDRRAKLRIRFKQARPAAPVDGTVVATGC